MSDENAADVNFLTLEFLPSFTTRKKNEKSKTKFSSLMLMCKHTRYFFLNNNIYDMR